MQVSYLYPYIRRYLDTPDLCQNTKIRHVGNNMRVRARTRKTVASIARTTTTHFSTFFMCNFFRRKIRTSREFRG